MPLIFSMTASVPDSSMVPADHVEFERPTSSATSSGVRPSMSRRSWFSRRISVRAHRPTVIASASASADARVGGPSTNGVVGSATGADGVSNTSTFVDVDIIPAIGIAERDVVRQLNDEDEGTQIQAVSKLAELIDRVIGDEAERLASYLRENGCLAPLLTQLENPRAQQDALRIIGNLASSAVDAQAAETKRLLDELGAFQRILPLIYAQSVTTVVYALGSVQNMCAKREYAVHMRSTGADARLHELINNGAGGQAGRFARGCLSNMEAVLAPDFVPDPRLNNARNPLPMEDVASSPTSAPTTATTPPAQPNVNVASPLLWLPSTMLPDVHPSPALANHKQANPTHLSRQLSACSSTAMAAEGERCTPICSVCYEEPIGTALTPCFHAAFCHRCAVTIAFNHMPCPMCRSPVSGIQRIYLS